MTLAEVVQWTDEAGRRTDGPGYSPITEKQRRRLAELSRKAKAFAKTIYESSDD